ncbi:MAG: hypothetical protein OER88_08980 [Planctomycetota bacterium]|nr:hypothetical protein [Planctomycetota bacterium]
MGTQGKKHRNERGVVLIAALFFAVTAMAYVASIISSGVAVHNQKRYMIAAERALDAAEAGVHHTLAAFRGGESIADLALKGLNGTLQGDTDRAIAYRVLVAEGGADGADNDLDGLVDEDEEKDMIEVISTGSADNITRTVRVTMMARYRTPTIPAAVYIADAGAGISLKGNAFMISGFEYDKKGAKVAEGVIKPAIGVAGNPDAIKKKISKKALDNLHGEGEPPILEVDPIDFNPLIEDAIRSADMDISGMSKPPYEGAWGTVTSPRIVFGQGDVHLSGGGGGAGILVIDGNLKISGGFEWVGLLIVRGKLDLTGGGSGKRLVGGLIVERELKTNSDSSSDPVDYSGQIRLIRDELSALTIDNPDPAAVDKIEDVVLKLDTAIHELTFNRDEGAAGAIDGAMADLKAAITAGYVGESRGNELLTNLRAIADGLRGQEVVSSGSLSTTGTVDILYSPRSVADIGKLFATMTILNWREGPTPQIGAAP